jgi:Fe-S cluster assembly protein SufD
MDTIKLNYFEEKYDQLQSAEMDSRISLLRKTGFETFNKAGFPTFRNEEWKYTDISSLFKKSYQLSPEAAQFSVTKNDIDPIRLPGYEAANELVFVNGCYQPLLSNIRTSADQLVVLTLDEALQQTAYREIIDQHLGSSSKYLKDGIHALNTSFIHQGLFIYVKKRQQPEQAIYIYNITDARQSATLAQPRTLLFADEDSKLSVAEIYHTLGNSDSFTNQVMEVVVTQNAWFEYYKIQHDNANSSQVSTTHIHQIGKCYVHALTVSLSGGMIRNNLNLIMDAPHNEAHLYGLYLLKDRCHVDNHTLVDNRSPNCFSNELYKGIVDDSATGVFSGKILVEKDAQKTNAYQSNKNIVLSDRASVNTKPQLEIFADDVKCSHGCTVGQLDEEALFYLRARGISQENAKAILLKAFASDILQQIKHDELRLHVEQLIANRLAVK